MASNLLFLEMLKQVAVFTVLAFVFSKFSSLGWLRSSHRPLPRGGAFVFFAGIAILGTYLGVEVQGALANSRAIGAVLAGLYGGPVMGLAVGVTAGLHRYLLGGFTDVACGLSTVTEGLTGGLVHAVMMRRGPASTSFGPLSPKVAAGTTFVAEVLQMIIILIVARPFASAWSLVQVIGLPMIAMNSTGAWLFAALVLDQRKLRDEMEERSTRLALDIAERAVGVLESGLDEQSALRLASTLRGHLPVGAVAVTDRSRVLAFEGIGSDHHRAGDPIASVVEDEVIAAADVHYLDGVSESFRCRRAPDCPLHSALIVPMTVEKQLVGTIVLFEPRTKALQNFPRAFGVGVAQLLSNQLVRNRLTVSELKLLQAQVKPHFLFNALNTIMAVIRSDPQRGRVLVGHLSEFMRTNLKRATPMVSFEEELEHVRSYLELEKARFGDRLRVCEDVPAGVRDLRVPTFTLQPLVENAIKHGLKDLVEGGEVWIRAEIAKGDLLVHVEDNGGSFDDAVKSTDGMGLHLVQRRSRLVFGDSYGVDVDCVPGEQTRVTLRLPAVAQQRRAEPACATDRAGV